MSYEKETQHVGHRKRIREKFISAGLDSFLDHEVLELLLTYCIVRKDTKPIAWVLLKQFGSLTAVLDASPKQLMSVEGVGKETACFLKLIRDTFKRYSLGTVQKTITIRSPQQVIDYCKAALAGKQEESLELIFLSVRHTIIGTQQISSGLIDRIAVSPRKIVENALIAKASAIILVHNHPSGDCTPSEADISFTQDTIRAAQLFGISICDHIIIGQNKHYSFRANGKM